MAARHADKGTRKIVLKLPKQGDKAIYANQKVLDALNEIQTEMTLYKGVRLLQVIEAAYVQGHKDGTNEAVDLVEQQMRELQKIRPKKIGRPKKSPRGA